MSGSFRLLTELACAPGAAAGEKKAWAEAYALWCRHVAMVATGTVRATQAKESFFIGAELREVVVEEVQTHLAMRARDIVTRVVPDAIASPLPLGDRAAVLAAPSTTEWKQALETADRVVDGYLRRSLANRVISELRRGSRRAEQELRDHAALAGAGERGVTEAVEGSVGGEAEDAYTRAVVALEAAVERVVAEAPARTQEKYAQQCADLQALAEARTSMEAVVLREMASESATIAELLEVTRATMGEVLDALAPSEDVEMLRERVADPLKLQERLRRERVTLERLERDAGRDLGAIDAVEARVSDFVAQTSDLHNSKEGRRVRDRVYKSHQRMREQLSLALTALEREGKLPRAEVEFAHRLVTELLQRRRHMPMRPASSGRKEGP